MIQQHDLGPSDYDTSIHIASTSTVLFPLLAKGVPGDNRQASLAHVCRSADVLG